MKNGIIYKSDGEKLIEIYRLFNANGSPKRKLSTEERVLIYAIGNALKKKAVEDAKDTNVPGRWIPISERLPEDESYILVSFKNCTMPDIARYEENDEGGTFYPGDEEESYSSYGLFVNAWMELPKPYKERADE